jgi:hypothetical protein
MFITSDIIATLTASVVALGYLRFGVLVIVNLILWRMSSLLGIIATLLTLGYFLHFF